MLQKQPLEFYSESLAGVDRDELQGKLIVIEGPDSVGRSTQVARLRTWLEHQGHAVLDTGLARGALAGKGISQAKRGNTLGPITMTLYYATDFADRLENEIIPALRAGFVVLTDRYIFSLMARAIARGEDRTWIERVAGFALVPHAVYYLRADVRELLTRVVLGRGAFDHWESGMDMRFGSDMHDSFVRYQTRVIRALDRMAKRYDFVIIDATKTPDQIFPGIAAVDRKTVLMIRASAWVLASLVSATICLMAQIPQEDSRNVTVPNTDTHFVMPVYHTRAEWEAHKQKLRAQILFAAGLTPMPEKNPLHPVIFGRIEHSDYSIEKVYLETFPGYYLGGNLYRPRGRTGKFPGVLAPHGHWDYGRLEHQPLISVPLRCINLAKQGYVAFSYDMVGYNDTIQTPHDFGGPREQLWGFGPLGLQLWNSIRALDFLESLSDVDSRRLAVTGESGGGTQTFLLAAVDERVKYDAPVNMISGIMQGGGQCENAPGLRVDTFNVEIGAMMAPRPMLMVAATGDWTRNTPREEYPAVRSIYELYDRAANLEMVQIDAPHNYNQASREAMYGFFGKRILGEPKDVKEAAGIRVEKLQDMLVWQNRPLPKNALTYEQLLEQWITAAKKQNEATHDPAVLRGRLRLALGTEWPDGVLSERVGDRILLSRKGKGDRVSGIWVGTGVPSLLVVDPDGAEAARKSAGNSALLLTVFQTGDAITPRDRSRPYFLTFNRSDDANRVQDILTALAYLKQAGAQELRIAATGKAAIWAQFAAAIAPFPVVLDAKIDGFGGQDQDFIDRFFVPGIQRAGGLAAAQMPDLVPRP